MELTERQIKNFWSKVDVRGPNDCWPWLGGTDRRGYGLVSLNNKSYRAPRITILLQTGEMPDPDLDACHCCDNPICVNPGHVSGCTRSQNMQDAARRGRIRSQKQKLTEAQVEAIRRDRRTQKVIAQEYGLDPSTVSKIKSGAIWKNLPS